MNYVLCVHNIHSENVYMHAFSNGRPASEYPLRVSNSAATMAEESHWKHFLLWNSCTAQLDVHSLWLLRSTVEEMGTYFTFQKSG